MQVFFTKKFHFFHFLFRTIYKYLDYRSAARVISRYSVLVLLGYARQVQWYLFHCRQAEGVHG